ncbi:hypothetical protein BGZ58_008141 [Dissophora ornata]|nr:hypothetical protein BGZ58_008141 [Dissophora ornata]
MAVLTASEPANVLGLPQPADNFPRRFRNRAPLAIRQIVSKQVLEQWSSDPQHVARALNQSVQAGDQRQSPQQQGDQQQRMAESQTIVQDHTGSTTEKLEGANSLSTVRSSSPVKSILGAEVLPASDKDPLLPVMVAEDTKNFMDNPQFTKKIAMTAKEIVARVLVHPSLSSLSHSGSEIKGTVEADEANADMFVPDLQIHDAQTLTHANAASCPLCESYANEQANFDDINHHGDNENDNNSNNKRKDKDSLRRFYYRGVVPSSLYSDLRIPDILASLSPPQESTPFAGPFNKDLMRIWMSLAGATTPLHYDRCHGILVQLVGRKRFVVFSHEDTNNLYPYDGITGPGHASKDIHLMENTAEVLERWPKVKNTDPWIIDLEPGDALYTPPGFWHEVTSADNSISVTIAWDMDASELQHVPRHMF